MGFMSPELPDVDHDTWPTLPRATRLQVVTRHWAEHGFGTPYAVYLLYLIKIALYVAAPAAIISLTPGLGGLSHIADWWTQPIVYQKFIVFTLLFEVAGFGCGSGPLTGRFMPPIGGFLYWLRPNTIRLPAWPDKVPFTRGDSRSVIDVVLYAVVLISGVWALVSPGHGGPVTAAWRRRPDRPRSGHPDDRRPGAVGSARQDHLPGRARRTLLAETDRVLFPVHRPDRGLQDHHAVPVVGGSDIQTQPPFPVRRGGDDEQQRAAAQQAVQPGQAPALSWTTSTTCARPGCRS